MHGSDANVPPGWRENPSSWPQRIPIVVIAIGGFFVASYLALYQLDVLDTVWEPFFGDGSRTVLNSRVSHVLPVPDAAIGAAGYLVDAIAGVIGGTRRWERMPWIVVLFGIAVGPLGIVSILLVVLQPVAFDSFCTLCLLSAVISLVLIPFAIDEVLASLQHLKRVRAEGRSTWRAFWGQE